MATTRAGLAATLPYKILADIALLARELEAHELSIRLSGQENLSVGLVVQHAATFSVAMETRKGPLSPNVEDLRSTAGLRTELDRRLARARQEAGERMEQWAGEQAGEYRSLLPPERCMREAPIAAVQEVCGACSGRMRVTCPGCSGAQRVTCGGCGGRGRVNCPQCGGARSVPCWSCGGRGSFEKIERELSYGDRQATMNQERQLVRQVPCTSCGASGRQSCSSCGDGTVTCNGCGGAREVNCPHCGASGTVRCGHCAATGAIHHAGWIRCAVSRGIRVDVTSPNAEDQQTFRERVSFDQIGALASSAVRLDRSERAGGQLTLYYTASVPLECAEATAGAQSVPIRAYGLRREIYNYHGLVGKLLEPDLASLEQSLRGHSLVHSLFRGSAGSTLAGVMKRFLASEVNALIAEGATKSIEPHLATGTLIPEYIQRASAAVGRAAPRLYSPLVLPMAAWVTAGITALFWIVRTNFFRWTPNEKVVTLMAIAGVSWFAVEARVQSRLKAILGPAIYERMKGQFASTRNRYRLLPVAGFAFAWYATFLIFRLILHFRFGYPMTFWPQQ